MFDSIFELGVSTIIPPSPTEGKDIDVIGIKTGDELKRVHKVKLEQAYAADPVVFNIVNKYVFGVLQNEYNIVGANKEDQKKIDEFIERVKLRNIVLPKMVQNMCIFGTSWNEVITAKETGRILRLDTRDPKYMDVARTKIMSGLGTSWPLTNDFGEPEYYVQYIPYERMAKNPSRETRQLGQKAIRYNPEDLLVANLFSLGDSNDGMGIIEPMMRSISDKWEIEESTKSAIKRIGNPIIYASVGDDRVFPTKQIIDSVTEKFRNITSRTGFAVPSYVKPDLLESKKPDKLTVNLEYYNSQIIAAGGLPESLSTGQGQGANEHTLESLMNFLSGAFLMLQMKISESFNSQIFPLLVLTEKLSEKPKFVWTPLMVIEDDVGGDKKKSKSDDEGDDKDDEDGMEDKPTSTKPKPKPKDNK